MRLAVNSRRYLRSRLFDGQVDDTVDRLAPLGVIQFVVADHELKPESIGNEVQGLLTGRPTRGDYRCITTLIDRPCSYALSNTS